MKFQNDTYLSVPDALVDADGEWIDLRLCLGVAFTITGTGSASGDVSLMGSNDREAEVEISSVPVDASQAVGANSPDLFWSYIRFKYVAGASGAGTVTVKATIKGA